MLLDEYPSDGYDGGYDVYSYDGYHQDDGTLYEYDFPITDAQQIVNYIYEFGWLPENFITKDEAREMGWDSSRNYVGDVAPGMSIGGDVFGNYEELLPEEKGRIWYECDVNYRGKKRGAERLVFSSDGLFYYTIDHYESFTEMFPEEYYDTGW
ncbi:MAG: ribonuclease [Clostridia bacterium]|nr:ribonuclease [Clostridia bacterium]